MKIAVISDTHANLPALRAVLAHAKKLKVSEIWHLGDMVGYGPFPNETIACLRRSCSRNVCGNYDLKSASARVVEKIRKSNPDRDKTFSFVWTHNALSAQNKSYITALPWKDSFEIKGSTFLLVHGSPAGIDDGIFKDTATERLKKLAFMARADVILCGHTHEFFERRTSAVFINPGSVGRSFDGDYRATYCVITISKEGELEVKPYRVAYDKKELTGTMRRLKFPERLVRSMTEGRSLDARVRPAQVADVAAESRHFAKDMGYEDPHSEQVAKLSLAIYDSIYRDAGSPEERALLESAAVLHDIGLAQGGAANHHKRSRDLIKEAPFFLRGNERLLIALVARYHRKALPSNKHRDYRTLTKAERATVKKLSAILRIADGLDRTHRSIVKAIQVDLSGKEAFFRVSGPSPTDDELKYGRLKADLFEKVFRKRVRIIEDGSRQGVKKKVFRSSALL